MSSWNKNEAPNIDSSIEKSIAKDFKDFTLLKYCASKLIATDFFEENNRRIVENTVVKKFFFSKKASFNGKKNETITGSQVNKTCFSLKLLPKKVKTVLINNKEIMVINLCCLFNFSR